MTLFLSNSTENLLPYDGEVYDCGKILSESRLLYQQLLQILPWQSDRVTLFGKTYITSRKIIWMSERDYRYSGQIKVATPWRNEVFHVKQLVENHLATLGFNINFNACLLNYYPTGNDGMGYHADNEAELGEQPLIASLSLGVTRKFVFKHRVTKDKVELPLQSGQLILMAGDTQQHWVHSLPKTKKITEGRINLTFRKIG